VTAGGGDHRREEYTARINRVIDYVEGHVDDDLSLEVLAGVACFSRFHFHRRRGAICRAPTLLQSVVCLPLGMARSRACEPCGAPLPEPAPNAAGYSNRCSAAKSSVAK
jgi:hypothetical protein